MNRRRSGSGAVLAATLILAVLPTAAVASPQMVDNMFSEVVGVGQKVIAETTTNVTFTATDSKGVDQGTVTCTKGVLTGPVTTNNGVRAEFTIETVTHTGAEAEGKCASTIMGWGPVKVTAENLPWCFSSTTLALFSIGGGSCGAGASNVKFTFKGAFVTCTYERVSLGGSYVKKIAPAALATVAQTFKLTAGGGSCPAEGHLTGTYLLHTDASPFTPIAIE